MPGVTLISLLSKYNGVIYKNEEVALFWRNRKASQVIWLDNSILLLRLLNFIPGSLLFPYRKTSSILVDIETVLAHSKFV